MTNTTTAPSPTKYPLTLRADGRWVKKIHGIIHYFTGTADGALTEWLRVKDDLIAGRQLRPKVPGSRFI